MSRQIITARTSGAYNAFPSVATATEPREKPDTYKDRLYKYIPGEVIALYLALSRILATAADAPPMLQWVVFGVGLIATPYYLSVVLHVRSKAQLLVSTAAFVVWTFALGGPFAQLGWYKPVYGALLLPTYTFFIAAYAPKQTPAR